MTETDKTRAVAGIRVFVHMASAVLRRGLIGTLERFPGVTVGCNEASEYLTFSAGSRSRVDVLVADAMCAGPFLSRIAHATQPKRILLAGVGGAPLDVPVLRSAEVCGWLSLAQAGEHVDSMLLKTVTCTERRCESSRCTACCVPKSTQPLALPLSDQESAVFYRMGEGLGPDQIARDLGLSVKTIEAYRARIKDKLGIHGRHELMAAACAWRLGLLCLSMNLRRIQSPGHSGKHLDCPMANGDRSDPSA